MTHMIYKLAELEQPETVVISLGLQSSNYLIVDILHNVKIKNLYILANTAKELATLDEFMEELQYDENYIAPNSITIMHRNRIREIAPVCPLAYMYDAPDRKDILMKEIELLKPEYLLGTHPGEKMNNFDIWESCKDFSNLIYLVAWRAGLTDEILDWTKPENGMELSVIFPMYNVAQYLHQCIDSIIQWDAPYVEYLFVDDGSPDNSAEIVKEYAAKDSRVKLLSKTNGGCASARQFGLEHATGRYIGFIDPDDFIDPTMYRKLFARAMMGSYQVSYCGYKEYYDNTGTTADAVDNIFEPYSNGVHDEKKIQELVAYLRVAIWRGIYSKNLIDETNIHFYTDLRRFDDLPFKVEIHSVAKSIVSVPEYLYYYRLARPGQDVAADDERLYVHFDIYHHLDNFLGKKATNELTEYALLSKVKTHRYAIEKIKPEFLAEYCSKTAIDFAAAGMSCNTGMAILKKIGSRSDRLYYWALRHKQFWLVKMLKQRYGK